MNDCEFIQERETGSGMTSNVLTLTGWETVVFQLEDVPPDD